MTRFSVRGGDWGRGTAHLLTRDVVRPDWRAKAVGVYRLWRDAGYAVGALIVGLLANALGMPAAIAAFGGLTFLSGVIVAGVMYETLTR